MKRKLRLSRAQRWAIGVPAGLLVLILLAAFIVGNSGASAFRDDVDAILAAPRGAEAGELSFNDDGSAVLRLYKNDIYALAEENGYLTGIRRELHERFGSLDLGFRLSDGKMRVCISKRVLGLVPVSLLVQTAVSWDGTGIVVHAERVLLGTRTELPESLWPRGIREDFRVDLAASGRTQEIETVYLEGNTAVVETVPLRLPDRESLHADVQLLEEIRFFSTNETARSAAELFSRITAGEILTEDELPAGSRAELITWLLALETGEGGGGEMFAGFFAGHSERVRQELRAELSGEEDKYIKLLTSVREQYKSGALRIEEKGFCLKATGETFNPFESSELSAAATDARVILLTSGSGTAEVTSADMPVLKSVPRRGRSALDGLDPEHAYDMGVVLTTDGGVPVLLYRRANGEIVVRELTEERYVDILVSGGRPVLNVDTLPEAASELVCPACRVLVLE